MGISPDSLLWGLMMMVVGMGVVFALLGVLMLVLIGIGRMDASPAPTPTAPTPEPDAATTDATAEPEASAPPSPPVRIIADGLDEDQVAAITVAVMTHAENRRRLAAPETRAHAPGSQLFASRWLSVGRGTQNQPFSRR